MTAKTKLHHPAAFTNPPSPQTAATIAAPPPPPEQPFEHPFVVGFAVLFVLWVLWAGLNRTPSERKTAHYRKHPPFLMAGEAKRFAGYRQDVAYIDYRPRTYGFTRYAGMGELAAIGLFADRGIPLGYCVNSAEKSIYNLTGWLRYDGAEHLISFGPAGSGKLTTCLAHVLLSPIPVGNLFVVDSKGELSAISVTASNQAGSRAFYINPFYLFSNKGTASLIPDATPYNPMDGLDPAAPDFVADCDAIISNLIEETGNTKDDFFNGTASKLIGGLIYFYKRYAPSADQNLVAVYKTIARPDLFADTIEKALEIDDELLLERFIRYKDLRDTQRSAEDILRTAEKQLSFISDPAIAKSLLGGRGFTFAELRKPNTRVFLILPGKHLGTHSRWFRLLVSCGIRELMSDIAGARVTMLLDEAAQLGYMQQLVVGMPQTRGYRLRFWPIFQDLPQIRRIYGEAAQTLISSCGIQQFFAPTDLDTAKFISERCGRFTEEVKSTSKSKSTGTGVNRESETQSESTSQIGRPLVDPMEVLNWPADRQWLFSNKIGFPIWTYRQVYWDIPVLWNWANPNPYHLAEAA